jgi:FixJ family two-component response regulator
MTEISAAERAIVFVVDDDDALRDSVRVLLDSVGLASEGYASGAEFLAAWRDVPGCALLDVRMPDMSGLRLQDEMAARKMVAPVVFMTGHGDVPMAVEAMKKGAVDFVEKPCRDEDLLECVRRAIAADAERRRAGAVFRRITPREREVLERVLAGKAGRVIARELGISEKTIEFHRARIMQRLGVRSREELFAICRAPGAPLPQ